LTTNGKVDRRALPIPDSDRPDLQEVYEAPRSEVERAIANIWQEVLHLEKVGIDDNFFDLGGHSLLMVQVHKKLQEVYNKEITIVEIFQNPTINSLAQKLSQETKDQTSFETVRDRTQKQIEALKLRKEKLMKSQKR
jgi:acyl carrier protein